MTNGLPDSSTWAAMGNASWRTHFHNARLIMMIRGLLIVMNESLLLGRGKSTLHLQKCLTVTMKRANAMKSENTLKM